jgi:hypothetical protein
MYDALSLVLTWRPATTTAPMGQRITGTHSITHSTLRCLVLHCITTRSRMTTRITQYMNCCSIKLYTTRMNLFALHQLAQPAQLQQALTCLNHLICTLTLTHVTIEAERQALRDRYSGVASAAYVNSFLESLPRDMLFVLRTGDLVRGLNKALGGTSRERLQILGEAGTFSSN